MADAPVLPPVTAEDVHVHMRKMHNWPGRLGRAAVIDHTADHLPRLRPDGTPAFGHTHSEPPAAGAGGDVGTDDEGASA